MREAGSGERNGKVAGIAHVFGDEQVLLITEQGMIIRMDVGGENGISIKGRATQGVRVINVEENDRVVAAVKVVEKEQADENGGEAPSDDGSAVH